MDTDGEDTDESLPQAVLEEAERLTRLAREAADDAAADAYRADREELLAAYDYEARVRDGDVLVCYPSEWLEDGVIRVEAVEDLSRGVEIPLSSSEADWEAIDAHNRAVASTLADRHGEPHGATAAALADFASNHYAVPIESLTSEQRREFIAEYLPRNAWPSEAQLEHADASVELALAVAEMATVGRAEE